MLAAGGLIRPLPMSSLIGEGVIGESMAQARRISSYREVLTALSSDDDPVRAPAPRIRSQLRDFRGMPEAVARGKRRRRCGCK